MMKTIIAAKEAPSNRKCKMQGKCIEIDVNEKIKECEGKCISRQFPFHGKCEYGQCLKHGKCLDRERFDIKKKMHVKLFKKCHGKCLSLEEKCDGKCARYQCESDDGSCISFIQDSMWQKCNGKCLPKGLPCKGKCKPLQCLREGRCLEAVNFDENRRYWRTCNGLCIHPYEKCDGKCGFEQCEKDGVCIDLDKSHQNCGGKSLKKSQKCKGSCSYSQCESIEGVCHEMVEENETGFVILKHGICKGKCQGLLTANSTESCNGDCGLIEGYKTVQSKNDYTYNKP